MTLMTELLLSYAIFCAWESGLGFGTHGMEDG